ncbi:MAG TPA: bifunctional diaminohydroxyphosphoribosylaminopyrimidine deaminase/5-amino-6-(5-phosphoribosylamino)uracil reductase RibD [Chthoniobacterales bacterium]|jgi:diaminohydroxyphosphoribosylaminopyrimidine deaminase/5-amino-6-(5-phosphoribosylamino)uracil reductase
MRTDGQAEKFMRAALLEARKGLGQTSPNPAVGAVLVIRNRIVASGHHRGPGQPHAEVECLTRWKKEMPADATLFITLEPCSTTGRTGPCTSAIIGSSVKNVVIGNIDVNPRHHGRGLKLLEKAGIKVRVGVLEEECKDLNEYFNKWIVTGLPFVIAKCGMSLDGHLRRSPGESQWLTSAGARRHAHRLRAGVDAILVGAETVRRDNPRLTVRGIPRSKQPLRIVLTRSGELPSRGHLFEDRFKDRTFVYRNNGLADVLADLGKRDITSVLIEGGGKILGEALDTGVIDKIQVYIAPLFTGGPVVAFGGQGCSSTGDATQVERIAYERVGGDICVSGYVRDVPIRGQAKQTSNVQRRTPNVE